AVVLVGEHEVAHLDRRGGGRPCCAAVLTAAVVAGDDDGGDQPSQERSPGRGLTAPAPGPPRGCGVLVVFAVVAGRPGIGGRGRGGVVGVHVWELWSGLSPVPGWGGGSGTPSRSWQASKAARGGGW